MTTVVLDERQQGISEEFATHAGSIHLLQDRVAGFLAERLAEFEQLLLQIAGHVGDMSTSRETVQHLDPEQCIEQELLRIRLEGAIHYWVEQYRALLAECRHGRTGNTEFVVAGAALQTLGHPIENLPVDAALMRERVTIDEVQHHLDDHVPVSSEAMLPETTQRIHLHLVRRELSADVVRLESLRGATHQKVA